MVPYDSQVYMSGWRLSRAAVPAVPAVPAEPVSVEATRRVGAWDVMGPRNRWNECQLDIWVYIQHHPTIVWLIICDMWIYLEYHPDIKLIVWHSLQVCINKGGDRCSKPPDFLRYTLFSNKTRMTQMITGRSWSLLVIRGRSTWIPMDWMIFRGYDCMTSKIAYVVGKSELTVQEATNAVTFWQYHFWIWDNDNSHAQMGGFRLFAAPHGRLYHFCA